MLIFILLGVVFRMRSDKALCIVRKLLNVHLTIGYVIDYQFNMCGWCTFSIRFCLEKVILILLLLLI